MENIVFLVQGSAVDPYRVTFRKEGSNLNAYCTCPASANGQYCKHRFAILGGETAGIVSRNADQVQTVVTWLPGTDVAEALKALIAAERKFENARKSVIKARDDLAASLLR